MQQEIQEGYKQTEVGIIPEDWEVKPISQLCIKVGSGVTPTGGEKVYKNSGRPFIRSQNIGWGRLLLDDVAHIDDETHKSFESSEICFGDVFLNITGASIGRSAIATEEIVGGNVNQHVCIIRLNRDFTTPFFLNSYILSNNGQKQIENYQAGGNRQGLNFNQVKSINVALPPTIQEQTAIAEALGGVDDLINSLEQLIEKKRLIKQGAMQQLLTPKEGWVVKRLGEVVGKITTGKLDANAMKAGGKYHFYTCAKEFYYIDNYAFDCEALLISGNGANLGYIHYYHGKFNAYQRTYVLTDFSVDVNFIKLYLERYLSERISLEVSASNTPYIRKDAITGMDIKFPRDLKQQTQIATILSDMDTEIEVLEKKLSKYKMLKLGMMQNLLTGKIRLI